MDPIELILRLLKGSALTHAEMDGNLVALRTACEQLLAALDAKLGADAATEITDTKPSPVGADQFIGLDSAADGNPVLITKTQLLASTQAQIDTLAGTVDGIETILASI